MTAAKPRFMLGRILMTPGAIEAMQAARVKPSSLIVRHMTGDWGDLDATDKRHNEQALKPAMPLRILSSYKLGEHETVWIITEWDRSVTTLLLPSEY